jgi:hypothetical protein
MLTLLKQSHLKICFFFIAVCLVYGFVDAFSQLNYNNQHYSYSINLNESDDDHTSCPSFFSKNLPFSISIEDNHSFALYLAISYFFQARETLHRNLILSFKASDRAPPLS